MFSWISHRRETKKQKNKQSQERDSSIAENGLGEEQVVRFVNDIKMKAETAAENEVKPNITIEEKVEKSAQPQGEGTVAEPVEAITEELLERRLPKEGPDSEETKPDLPEGDSQTLYTDEVELAIAAPVDLKLVSSLYESLQTIRELRILHTSGSANRGTIITVVLESPMPLISIISSKMPGVEATPESPGNNSSVERKWNSLLGKEKKEMRRIKLAVNEGNASSHG